MCLGFERSVGFNLRCDGFLDDNKSTKSKDDGDLHEVKVNENDVEYLPADDEF